MSTSHPTVFPYCTYCRAKNSGMMQCTIEHIEATGNHDSDFDPQTICIHGRECIVVTKNIPHFYPSQCGPVEAIPCPDTSNWSLSSAMESIENCAWQMEQALVAIISHGTSFVHNQWLNATTKLSPHKVLLEYAPATTGAITSETNNAVAEDRQTTLKEHRTVAVQALNKTAQSLPPA